MDRDLVEIPTGQMGRGRKRDIGEVSRDPLLAKLEMDRAKSPTLRTTILLLLGRSQEGDLEIVFDSYGMSMSTSVFSLSLFYA